MPWGWLWMTGACGTSSPALELEGPAEVRVNRLGPVHGPKVVLDDGSIPTGVIWSVSKEGVARLSGDQVIAEGAGEVDIIAEWEGARVEWTLIVEPATLLSLVDPPPRLKVGERRAMVVRATAGERHVDPGPIEWEVSHPEVLRV